MLVCKRLVSKGVPRTWSEFGDNISAVHRTLDEACTILLRSAMDNLVFPLSFNIHDEGMAYSKMGTEDDKS